MEWLNESALSSSILGIPSSEVRNNGPILIAQWNQHVLDNLCSNLCNYLRTSKGLQVRMQMFCFNADFEKGHNQEHNFCGRMSQISVVKLSYKEVKDGLQNSFSGLALVTVSLQGCEMRGSPMEEHLDRTMAQACAGTSLNNTTGGGTSRVIGIHLNRGFILIVLQVIMFISFRIILFQLPINTHEEEFARNVEKWQRRKSHIRI